MPTLTRRGSPSPRKRACGAGCRAGLFAVGLAALAATADAAPRPAIQEYDLKAAFLFNFARFVEWPADAFADPTSPITIAILGDDPFGSSLDEIVANETVNNRKLIVTRYRSLTQAEPCHILFIGHAEAAELERILADLNHRSILTVGETNGFAARSGMIEFVLSQRRLRMRINVAAATAARLTISSKLLRQAIIVRAPGSLK